MNCITYFKAICTNTSEQLYVDRIFQKDELQPPDIDFLIALQKHARTREEKHVHTYEKTLSYTTHLLQNITEALIEEEKNHTLLKDNAFSEAFSQRATQDTIQNELFISEIRNKLQKN